MRKHFDYLEVYRNDEYVRREVTKDGGANLKRLTKKGFIGPAFEFGSPQQQTNQNTPAGPETFGEETNPFD